MPWPFLCLGSTTRGFPVASSPHLLIGGLLKQFLKGESIVISAWQTPENWVVPFRPTGGPHKHAGQGGGRGHPSPGPPPRRVTLGMARACLPPSWRGFLSLPTTQVPSFSSWEVRSGGLFANLLISDGDTAPAASVCEWVPVTSESPFILPSDGLNASRRESGSLLVDYNTIFLLKSLLKASWKFE